MKKLKSSFVNMTVVLTVISVIAGGALAAINEYTKGPIAAINEKNLQNGIKQVILGTADGNLTIASTDSVDENTVIYTTDQGVAVQTVTNGFGGPLKVLVGFDADGVVKGYTILSTQETPGLGAKADTWFQKDGKGNIIGKNPGERPLSVSKDGGEVDAITASTITSRAFLKAVNAAYAAYKGGDATADAASGASQQASRWDDSATTDNAANDSII